MHFAVGAIIALLGSLALAAPASHVQHDKRSEVADGQWVKRDRAPASVKLPVRIALAQRNLHLGHDMLMDVASPHSPNFGKHWTAQEVAEKFAPSHQSIHAVGDWLTASGIASDRYTVSPGKHWIKFDATLGELEGLLHTEYHVFEHPETSEMRVACDDYHLPKSIHQHVDYITPTISLRGGRLRKEHRRQRRDTPEPFVSRAHTSSSRPIANNATCAQAVLPECIRQKYGIAPAPTTPQPGNELGVFEDTDRYSQPDLDAFWGNFSKSIPAGTGPTLKSLDGSDPAPNGGESLLDLELAYPLVYPQTVWVYQMQFSERDPTFKDDFEWLLDAVDSTYCASANLTNARCGAYKLTNVISISYGSNEFEVPAAEMQRECAEFMKLSLQGSSILLASGDRGVSNMDANRKAFCNVVNGKEVFGPQWPATCPYVTAIGATQLAPSGNLQDPEAAAAVPAKNFSSSGGFSNVFGLADYQATAVQAYLQNNPPPFGDDVYNRSGRAFPDISAIGQNIMTIGEGAQGLHHGTSASTPIVASMINLINEDRLRAGKNPVGFLNPTLYANPGAFNDITSGNNAGCNTNGFTAAPGWDPVTGLGTPVYQKLHDVFMALP